MALKGLDKVDSRWVVPFADAEDPGEDHSMYNRRHLGATENIGAAVAAGAAFAGDAAVVYWDVIR